MILFGKDIRDETLMMDAKQRQLPRSTTNKVGLGGRFRPSCSFGPLLWTVHTDSNTVRQSPGAKVALCSQVGLASPGSDSQQFKNNHKLIMIQVESNDDFTGLNSPDSGPEVR